MQADEDLCAFFGAGAGETIDEAAMDDLFREILAAPPTPTSPTPSLTGGEVELPGRDQDSPDVDTDMDAGKEVERVIQGLFDLVPVTSTALGLTLDGVPPLAVEEGGNTALELDLGVWEASIGLTQPVF